MSGLIKRFFRGHVPLWIVVILVLIVAYVSILGGAILNYVAEENAFRQVEMIRQLKTL